MSNEEEIDYLGMIIELRARATEGAVISQDAYDAANAIQTLLQQRDAAQKLCSETIAHHSYRMTPWDAAKEHFGEDAAKRLFPHLEATEDVVSPACGGPQSYHSPRGSRRQGIGFRIEQAETTRNKRFKPISCKVFRLGEAYLAETCPIQANAHASFQSKYKWVACTKLTAMLFVIGYRAVWED